MSHPHRGSVVRPTLEVISSTDGTTRAELIALPTARASRRADRVLHQVAAEALRNERPQDSPPRTAA